MSELTRAPNGVTSELKSKTAGAAVFAVAAGDHRIKQFEGSESSPADAFEKHQDKLREAVRPMVDEAEKLILFQNYDRAEAALKKAVGLVPDLVEAHVALGRLYLKKSDTGAAIDHFKTALRFDPQNAEAFAALGGQLWGAGQIADAYALFAQAFRCDPTNMLVLSRLLHAEAHLADWRNFPNLEGIRAELKKAKSNIEPFAMLPLADDPAFQLERSAVYSKLVHQVVKAQPLPKRKRQPGQKIRLGYFSADFFDHATMLLMARHLELHDKEQFEVVLYDYGSKSKGELYHRAVAASDDFHDVRDMTDAQISALARKHELDIAVDLKGYTEGGRSAIFAARIAPVQVSYLGYPGSLGMSEMDYIMADPTVIPSEEKQHYSEHILYMPNCYQVNDNTRKITEPMPSRAELGLPEKGVVFCSFNNTYKVTPVEFDIWMNLLQKVPESVLWCFVGDKTAEANLIKEAATRGVSADRIVFAERVPQGQHMARMQAADIFLDTFNVNAHTTASDAILAGVPVVTKLGRQFAARVAGSLLTNSGMEDLVAQTEAEYEAIALKLAQDPGYLKEVKTRLAVNRKSCPLFDTEGFTRDFEQLLSMAFARHHEGKKPADLSLT